MRVDYQGAFRHRLDRVGETDHFQKVVLLIFLKKGEFFVTQTDRTIYTHRYADTVFDENLYIISIAAFHFLLCFRLKIGEIDGLNTRVRGENQTSIGLRLRIDFVSVKN